MSAPGPSRGLTEEQQRRYVADLDHPWWCRPSECGVRWDAERGYGPRGEHVGPQDVIATSYGEVRIRLTQYVVEEELSYPPEVRIELESGAAGLLPYEVDQLVAALARRVASLREPDWTVHR